MTNLRKMLTLQEKRYDEGKISVNQKKPYRIGYEDGDTVGYRDGKLIGLGIGGLVGLALGALSMFGVAHLQNSNQKQPNEQEKLAMEYCAAADEGREHFIGVFPNGNTAIRESMLPNKWSVEYTPVYAVDLDSDDKDDIKLTESKVGRAMYDKKYTDLRAGR